MLRAVHRRPVRLNVQLNLQRDDKHALKYFFVSLLAVMLSWQDNSNNEGGFLIEKTISGNCTSGFVEVARVGVNISLWADDLAQPGDCYRVAAFNNDGVSSYT